MLIRAVGVLATFGIIINRPEKSGQPADTTKTAIDGNGREAATTEDITAPDTANSEKLPTYFSNRSKNGSR